MSAATAGKPERLLISMRLSTLEGMPVEMTNESFISMIQEIAGGFAESATLQWKEPLALCDPSFTLVATWDGSRLYDLLMRAGPSLQGTSRKKNFISSQKSSGYGRTKALPLSKYYLDRAKGWSKRIQDGETYEEIANGIGITARTVQANVEKYWSEIKDG